MIDKEIFKTILIRGLQSFDKFEIMNLIQSRFKLRLFGFHVFIAFFRK